MRRYWWGVVPGCDGVGVQAGRDEEPLPGGDATGQRTRNARPHLLCHHTTHAPRSRDAASCHPGWSVSRGRTLLGVLGAAVDEAAPRLQGQQQRVLQPHAALPLPPLEDRRAVAQQRQAVAGRQPHAAATHTTAPGQLPRDPRFSQDQLTGTGVSLPFTVLKAFAFLLSPSGGLPT